jgi:hypothetical protein
MHSFYAVVTWTGRNLPYIIIIIIIEIFAINVLRNVQTSSNAKDITSFEFPLGISEAPLCFMSAHPTKLSFCQFQIGFAQMSTSPDGKQLQFIRIQSIAMTESS